jgi:hypothetical protein
MTPSEKVPCDGSFLGAKWNGTVSGELTQAQSMTQTRERTSQQTSWISGCRLSTHKTHRVGNNVVFSYFADFGRRCIIRDQHKRLAEHSRMALDVFLECHGRISSRPAPMCHIPGDSDQERWRLTACLSSKHSIKLVHNVTHQESGDSRRTAPRAGFLASSL